MDERLSISEEYDSKINEYMAQLEQLILLLTDEIRNPVEGVTSPSLLEILTLMQARLREGFIMRQAFGKRLREELKENIF